jgi:hypothetical protein
MDSLFVEAAGQMTLADVELAVVPLGALMRGSPSAATVLASIAEAYRVPDIPGVLRTARN